MVVSIDFQYLDTLVQQVYSGQGISGFGVEFDVLVQFTGGSWEDLDM